MLDIKIHDASIPIDVELILRQKDGIPVAFCPSGYLREWHIDGMTGLVRVRCQLPELLLARGSYSIDLILAHTGTAFLDYIESGLGFTIESAAVGPRNWSFDQVRNQGCFIWEAEFATEPIQTSVLSGNREIGS